MIKLTYQDSYQTSFRYGETRFLDGTILKHNDNVRKKRSMKFCTKSVVVRGYILNGPILKRQCHVTKMTNDIFFRMSYRNNLKTKRSCSKKWSFKFCTKSIVVTGYILNRTILKRQCHVTKMTNDIFYRMSCCDCELF